MPLTPEQQQELAELKRLDELEAKFGGDQGGPGPAAPRVGDQFASALGGLGDLAGKITSARSGLIKGASMGNLSLPQSQQLEEGHPNYATAGKLAGALGTGGLAMKSIPVGASLAGRMGANIGVGAGLGALEKPSEEDTLAARAEQAKTGALLGGALGVVGEGLGAAAKGAGGLYQWLRPAAKTKVNPEEVLMTSKQYAEHGPLAEKIAAMSPEERLNFIRAEIAKAKEAHAVKLAGAGDKIQKSTLGRDVKINPSELEGTTAEPQVQEYLRRSGQLKDQIHAEIGGPTQTQYVETAPSVAEFGGERPIQLQRGAEVGVDPLTKQPVSNITGRSKEVYAEPGERVAMPVQTQELTKVYKPEPLGAVKEATIPSSLAQQLKSLLGKESYTEGGKLLKGRGQTASQNASLRRLLTGETSEITPGAVIEGKAPYQEVGIKTTHAYPETDAAYTEYQQLLKQSKEIPANVRAQLSPSIKLANSLERIRNNPNLGAEEIQSSLSGFAPEDIIKMAITGRLPQSAIARIVGAVTKTAGSAYGSIPENTAFGASTAAKALKGSLTSPSQVRYPASKSKEE